MALSQNLACKPYLLQFSLTLESCAANHVSSVQYPPRAPCLILIVVWCEQFELHTSGGLSSIMIWLIMRFPLNLFNTTPLSLWAMVTLHLQLKLSMRASSLLNPLSCLSFACQIQGNSWELQVRAHKLSSAVKDSLTLISLLSALSMCFYVMWSVHKHIAREEKIKANLPWRPMIDFSPDCEVASSLELQIWKRLKFWFLFWATAIWGQWTELMSSNATTHIYWRILKLSNCKWINMTNHIGTVIKLTGTDRWISWAGKEISTSTLRVPSALIETRTRSTLRRHECGKSNVHLIRNSSVHKCVKYCTASPRQRHGPYPKVWNMQECRNWWESGSLESGDLV